jgi:hypothetical protein
MITPPIDLVTIPLALSGGQVPGYNLRANRMMELLPTGIHFLGVVPKPQLVELFAALKRLRQTYHLALADTAAHGRQHYGDAFVEATMEQLQFDLGDTARADAIGQVPRAMRHPSLTAEHYYVVAKTIFRGLVTADEEAEAAKWLAVAVEKGLSPHTLQESIKAGRVLPEPSAAQKKSGLPTIEGVRFLFDQWKSKVTKKEGDIVHWDAERKRRLLEELRPFIDLAQRLMETI